MKILFDAHGWQDYLWWQENDPKGLARLNDVIRDIARQLFGGIGKPEALRANLTGRDDDRRIEIIQCRYHY